MKQVNECSCIGRHDVDSFDIELSRPDPGPQIDDIGNSHRTPRGIYSGRHTSERKHLTRSSFELS